MTIITPAIKDIVLNYICETCELDSIQTISSKDFSLKTGLDFKILNPILSQFERNKLIEYLNPSEHQTDIVLVVEAHDYIQIGGFSAQELVFKSNLNKLSLEVENLKQNLEPKHLETANKISTITATLIAGLTLFR